MNHKYSSFALFLIIAIFTISILAFSELEPDDIGFLNATYLRLDTANDPILNDLDLGGHNLYGLNELHKNASTPYIKVNSKFVINGKTNISRNLYMQNNKTIEFGGYYGCINWYYRPISGQSSICGDFLSLNITAINVNFPKSQKLNLGSSSQTERVGLKITTQNGIDEFYRQKDNNAWQISDYLAWDSDNLVIRHGILLNTFSLLEANNITWDSLGCYFGDCELEINTVGNIDFNNQDSINFNDAGITAPALPGEANDSNSMYVCIDTSDGHLFINETGC